MKKILIVGGGGYIGCVLIDYLLNKNCKVICLDNFIYNHNYSIKKFRNNKNFKLIKKNLNKKTYSMFPKDLNSVIVLAGLVGDPITKKFKKEAFKINELEIKSLIKFFRFKKIRLIFISTCSNYGVQKSLADEKSKLRPKSIYAKQKVKIEKFIMSHKRKSIYNPVILRFATAFGISKRLRFDLTLNEFTLHAFLKKEIEIYDHKTWRPYCHVKDFAKIIYKCIGIELKKINFQIFNVGSNKNNCRKIDLARKIKTYFPQFKFLITSKSKDMRDYRVSFSKIRKKLKIKKFYSIDYGIREIKSFLKSKGVKNSIKFSKYGNYKIKNSL